MGLATQVKEN